MRTIHAASVLVFAASASAATFKVVAPGASDSVQVSVNGEKVDLHADDPQVPYYTGQASCSGTCKYKYIVDGNEENFDRTLEAETTQNDIFQRQVTYATSLPDLPRPVADTPEWTRGGKKGAIWDDHYIPSIFINGDPNDMETIVKKLTKEKKKKKANKKFPVTFTIIGPNEVQTFKDCQFGLHGGGKKHNDAKQSWEWSLPEGQFLDHRNWFKLRHMEEDPTQMREKLYADVLDAMGAPGNRANMVRLFINGQGFGTFNMLDDVIHYSYIRAVFYNGQPPLKMGPLYDGSSGADYQYLPEDESHMYSWQPADGSPEGPEAVQELAKAFKDVDVKDDAQIDEFSKKFDITSFLKFMVVEYLTGDWDGYWMQQTNDATYRDPTEDNKWYYLGQDYDATFGVNLAEPEGHDFVNISYKEFPKRYPNAVMINRLLENDHIRERFETYLKDTVTMLFNKNTLGRRIHAYHEFISHDLRWDRSIKQQSSGNLFGWTYEQTSENLYHSVNAPNPDSTGGGADWGLLEWIEARSEAVAKEFNLEFLSAEEALSRSLAPANNNNAATTPQTQDPQQNGDNNEQSNDTGSSLAGDAESAEKDSLKLHPDSSSGAAPAAAIQQPLTMALSTMACVMVATMVGYPF